MPLCRRADQSGLRLDLLLASHVSLIVTQHVSCTPCSENKIRLPSYNGVCVAVCVCVGVCVRERFEESIECLYDELSNSVHRTVG